MDGLRGAMAPLSFATAFVPTADASTGGADAASPIEQGTDLFAALPRGRGGAAVGTPVPACMEGSRPCETHEVAMRRCSLTPSSPLGHVCDEDVAGVKVPRPLGARSIDRAQRRNGGAKSDFVFLLTPLCRISEAVLLL